MLCFASSILSILSAIVWSTHFGQSGSHSKRWCTPHVDLQKILIHRRTRRTHRDARHAATTAKEPARRPLALSTSRRWEDGGEPGALLAAPAVPSPSRISTASVRPSVSRCSPISWTLAGGHVPVRRYAMLLGSMVSASRSIGPFVICQQGVVSARVVAKREVTSCLNSAFSSPFSNPSASLLLGCVW